MLDGDYVYDTDGSIHTMNWDNDESDWHWDWGFDWDWDLGGFMFSNDKGSSSGDQKLIRKANKDYASSMPILNASGLIQLGSFAKVGSDTGLGLNSNPFNNGLIGIKLGLDFNGYVNNISNAEPNSNNNNSNKSVIIDTTHFIIDSNTNEIFRNVGQMKVIGNEYEINKIIEQNNDKNNFYENWFK